MTKQTPPVAPTEKEELQQRNRLEKENVHLLNTSGLHHPAVL